MFNFRRSQPKKFEVEVAGVDGEKVQFRSADDLELNTPLQVTFTLDEPVEATFVVESYLPQDDLWQGSVQDPETLLAQLQERFPPQITEADETPKWEEKRSVDRVQKGLGVMCREFKNFKGLTHDITVEGARFISDGPHDPGAKLNIRMEIDDARVDALHFVAEVVWCQPREDSGQFYLGCKISLDDEQKEVLGEFLNFFRSYDDNVFAEQYARD